MTIRKILLFALICLTASMVTACGLKQSKSAGDAELHYKMGLSYLSEGQSQRAFVELQKALQEDPQNKDVLNALGLVYLQLDDYSQARECFVKATTIDPLFSDAYSNLGVTYLKTRKWQDATNAFKKALENPLYASPAKPLYYIGMVYYRTGEFDLAMESFRDALKRTPDFSPAYFSIALAFNRLGRYGDAALALTKGIEVNPSYRGDRSRFVADVQEKLITARGDDEADLRDYLDIANY